MKKLACVACLLTFLAGAVCALGVAASDRATKTADFEPAIYRAAKCGDLKKVKKLVAQGADVNSSNDEGETPLHVAAECGCVEIARFLLENGADANARNKDGETPLHDAAVFDLVQTSDKCDDDSAKKSSQKIANKIEILRLLVEKEADVNAQDKEKETPLHVVAEDGTLEAAKYLVENGANIEVKDDEGRTPEDVARDEGNFAIERFLIEKSVD